MTTQEIVMGCPGEEVLAAFRSHRLGMEARREVVHHVARCSECREAVLAMAEGDAGEAPASQKKSRFPAPRMLVALVLFAAIILFFRFGPIPSQRLSPSGMEALVLASAELPYRPVDGRIAGGFPYRPSGERGSQGGRAEDENWLRFNVVAAGVQEAAFGRESADVKHRLGVTFLALAEYDRATTMLRDAILLATNELDLAHAIDRAVAPALLNDLSVAYAARGKQDEQPQDLLVAAEAAQRAWELAKTPEAAWNRAKAFEAIGLRDQTLDAWRDYLRIDARSEWSREARASIERINTPTDSDLWEPARDAIERVALAGDDREVERLVQRFPQQARMWGERTLLPDWARLSAKGDDQAAERRLRIVEAIGTAVRDDAMLTDTVSDIRAAQRRRDGSLEALRAGLERYGLARIDYTEQRNAAASAGFAASALSLERAGARFALMARVFVAACAYYSNDFKTAESMTSLLAERPDIVRYSSVRAQLLWIRGLSRLQSGMPQSAASDFRSALGIFESMGETDNLLAMHELLSECLLYAGEDNEAFRQRAQAFALLRKSGRLSYRRPQMMISMARAALRSNAHRTALLCLNDNLAAEKGKTDSIDLRVNTLLWRSHILETRGDRAAADADLDEASALASRIADPDLRDYAVNTIEFVTHRLRASATAEERRRIIDEAVQFAEKVGNGYRVARLRLMQGREYEAAGDFGRAEQAMLEAIGHVERQRGFLSDEELRSSFLGNEQDAYDELMQLYWKRGDVQRAFAVAERARARTLLDRLSGHIENEPADLHAIMAALPKGVVVVQHAALDDHLLTWTITRDGVRTSEHRIPLKDLTRDCDRFVTAIVRNDSADIQVLSRRLYDVFIAPSEIREGETIILVPDARLANIPYAALVDRRGSSYLIARNAIGVLPSSTILTRMPNTGRQQAPTREDRVLLVAPEIPTTADLPSLPAALKEIRRISSLYSSATTQFGATATREAFVASVLTAKVIHFGGHTLIGRTALQSRLLFAGSGDRQTSLYAEEIQNLKLSASPVVILAACEGTRDTESSRQGTSSLSRAFLAAGAGAVVGSLWRVNDEPTADLLVRFHVQLAKGVSAVTALREAQLELLRSNHSSAREVRSWAGFTAMGGY